MSVEFAFWCLFFIIIIFSFVLYISISMLIEELTEEIIDEIREGENK